MSEQGHRFRELQDAYADYTVYDEHYERIGKVDDLFVDADGREHYIGVKMGVFGTKSTLIPMEIVRVNDRRRLVEVAVPKEAIENAPNFDDDEEISADYERRIHAYFGGPRPETLPNASDYFSPQTHDGPVDTEFGERAEVPMHPPERSDPSGSTDTSFPAEPAPAGSVPEDSSYPAEPPPEHEPASGEESRPAPPPAEDRGGDGIRVHRLRR